MSIARVRPNFQGPIDFAALRAAADPRAVEILSRWIEVDPKRRPSSDGEVWFINTHRGEKQGGSFSFNIKTGKGHDFGDPAYSGDIIALVGVFEGHRNAAQAAETIADIIGIEMPRKDPTTNGGRTYSRRSSDAPSGGRGYERGPWAPEPEAAPTPSPHPAFLLRLWHECMPVAGTPADAYLAGRSLSLPSDTRSLGFHPKLSFQIKDPRPEVEAPLALGQHPALIGALTTGDQGDPISLMRIYLTESGSRVQKLTIEAVADMVAAANLQVDAIRGSFSAKRLTSSGMGEAAVFLGTPAATLVIVEGIETGLAAAEQFYVAVSCGSSRLGKIAIPECVREIVIVPDRDADGRTTVRDIAERAAETYLAQGYTVAIAEVPAMFGEKADLNDVLMNGGTISDVVEIIEKAERRQPPEELKPDDTETDAAATNEGAAPDADSEAIALAPELPEPPVGVLEDIPGVLGDLAAYLRDSDPVGNEMGGLMMALATVNALTLGMYVCPILNWHTCTDLFLLGVTNSGVGKTSGSGAATRLVREIANPAEPMPLAKYVGVGSPEGMWDYLTDVASKTGVCATTMLIDEFGSELASMTANKNYKSGILRLVRDLTNQGNDTIHPAQLSSKTKQAPRQPLHYPVVSFVALSTGGQFIEALKGNRLSEDGTEARMIVLPCESTRLFKYVHIEMPESIKPDLLRIYETARSAIGRRHDLQRKPDRIHVQPDPDVPALIEKMKQQEQRDGMASARAGERWASVINRRVEHSIKLAMLWAISENPEMPRLTRPGIAWAERIIAYKEASFRALHGRHLVRGEKAQDSIEVRTRILGTVQRGHDRYKRTKGYIGVSLRRIQNSHQLGKHEAVTEVYNLMEQGHVEAFDKNGTKLLVISLANPAESTFVRPAPKRRKEL